MSRGIRERVGFQRVGYVRILRDDFDEEQPEPP
jgi:hypothetical protein